jgi:tight adherence protein B
MAPLAATIVFVGIVLASLLAFGGNHALRESRRAQLSRRIGPARRVGGLSRRRPGALASALGPVGRWMHALRVQAGRSEEATVVVGRMALFALAGIALTAWFLDGPGVVGGAMLGVVPLLTMLSDADARGRELAGQLPDALDLIARTLRTGQPLAEALRSTSDEVMPPLRDELAAVVEEHRLGVELRDALQGLIRRVPNSFEVRLWGGAMLLNLETGGNLIAALESLAATIRERVVFEDKVQALTAEVRASAWILAGLPPVCAILLLLFDPDYLQPLIYTDLGREMVLGASVALILGMVTMRRVSTVEM